MRITLCSSGFSALLRLAGRQLGGALARMWMAGAYSLAYAALHCNGTGTPTAPLLPSSGRYDSMMSSRDVCSLSTASNSLSWRENRRSTPKTG
jgi:hypothetical protein